MLISLILVNVKNSSCTYGNCKILTNEIQTIFFPSVDKLRMIHQKEFFFIGKVQIFLKLKF